MADITPLRLEGIECVLLDIEGTICPISFVKETLFPYAITALPAVLSKQWDSPTFAPYRDAFPEEYRASPEKLQTHVEDLTKRDVKISYLKNLQGYLWEDGYRTSAYSTPLFDDVAPKLKQWKSEGKTVAIYSSGSVFAQKLLMEHVNVQFDQTKIGEKRTRAEEEPVEEGSTAKAAKTDSSGAAGSGAGSTSADGTDEIKPVAKGKQKARSTEDLREIVSGWFDTTNAGLKADAQSYEKIAEDLKIPPSKILFLSDNVKEVDAAITAGMHSVVVDRPGNAELDEDDLLEFMVVGSFDAIELAASSRETES